MSKKRLITMISLFGAGEENRTPDLVITNTSMIMKLRVLTCVGCV